MWKKIDPEKENSRLFVSKVFKNNTADTCHIFLHVFLFEASLEKKKC